MAETATLKVGDEAPDFELPSSPTGDKFKLSDHRGKNAVVLNFVPLAFSGVCTSQLGLVEKMRDHFGTLKGRTIALWGLAFKPRTDDMREAPAIAIIDRLLALEATVKAYDPEAGPTARRLFGDRIGLCEKSYDALSGADALAIITEWNEFREPDFEKMRRLLRTPVVFDGRNIYSPEHMRALGFTYYSIGR